MKSSASTVCLPAITAALVLIAGLTGCGGGSGGSSSSSAASSSSGAKCDYPDQVTASERSQANACGIQVSSLYGNADSRLQQIIQACQAGQKATADAEYANTYAKLVQSARDNSRTLSCGSNSNSAAFPTSTARTFYNFCGKTSGNTRNGVCFGPVSQGEGGCGTATGYTYVSQHDSQDACTSAGNRWVNGR